MKLPLSAVLVLAAGIAGGCQSIIADDVSPYEAGIVGPPTGADSQILEGTGTTGRPDRAESGLGIGTRSPGGNGRGVLR